MHTCVIQVQPGMRTPLATNAAPATSLEAGLVRREALQCSTTLWARIACSGAPVVLQEGSAHDLRIVQRTRHEGLEGFRVGRMLLNLRQGGRTGWAIGAMWRAMAAVACGFFWRAHIL